ncbi:MAG: hypothetical protein HY823_13050 [Acidobacteria bacterium]|nr:hypothetical protein [Acidobacteriota bacterium]
MVLPLILAALLHPQFTPKPPPPTETSRPKAPPRLQVTPAGRVNLGSLGPREKRSQIYTFQNQSNAPISLRVLDLSAGVTVEGPALRGPIAPRGSAQLTLRVDPTDFVGWQTRNVKLGTDDPQQGEYLLPTGMTVRPDLTVDAVKKSLGEVGLHETPEAVFTFNRETGEPTRLKLTTKLPGYLEVAVEDPTAPAPGRPAQGALRFTLRPRLLEPGMVAGLESLSVETNAPHQPRFQLYLDWRIKLPAKVDPSRMVWLAEDEPIKKLVLESRDDRALEVDSLQVEGAGFSVGPPPGPGRRIEISVRREAGLRAKALLLIRLRGVDEALRVPLSYLPPEKNPGQPLSAPPK